MLSIQYLLELLVFPSSLMSSFRHIGSLGLLLLQIGAWLIIVALPRLFSAFFLFWPIEKGATMPNQKSTVAQLFSLAT